MSKHRKESIRGFNSARGVDGRVYFDAEELVEWIRAEIKDESIVSEAESMLKAMGINPDTPTIKFAQGTMKECFLHLATILEGAIEMVSPLPEGYERH